MKPPAANGTAWRSDGTPGAATGSDRCIDFRPWTVHLDAASERCSRRRCRSFVRPSLPAAEVVDHRLKVGAAVTRFHERSTSCTVDEGKAALELGLRDPALKAATRRDDQGGPHRLHRERCAPRPGTTTSSSFQSTMQPPYGNTAALRIARWPRSDPHRRASRFRATGPWSRRELSYLGGPTQFVGGVGGNESPTA